VQAHEEKGTTLSESDLEEEYGEVSALVGWKFTATDLTDLLHRVSEHEQAAATRQTDLAPAA
jgi:hypothetical protein